nr:hypothetical protein [Tanacetum cinerariifolium]
MVAADHRKQTPLYCFGCCRANEHPSLVNKNPKTNTLFAVNSNRTSPPPCCRPPLFNKSKLEKKEDEGGGVDGGGVGWSRCGDVGKAAAVAGRWKQRRRYRSGDGESFWVRQKSPREKFSDGGGVVAGRRRAVGAGQSVEMWERCCNLLGSGISYLQQGELSSLVVGTSSGNENSSLTVGMPCAFYSQHGDEDVSFLHNADDFLS